MDFFFYIGLPALLALVAAVLCDWWLPKGGFAALTVMATLLVPLMLIGLALGLGFWLMSMDCTPTAENPCHTGAMAAAGLLAIAGTASLFSLFIAPPLVYATLRWLRRP